MSITVAALYRYPVKSLSAQALTQVEVAADRPLPHDRRYAIAHGASRYDPAEPHWQPKASFLALVRNARLAKLVSHYDEASETLSIERDGREVVRGCLAETAGRAVIEQFLAAFMGEEARGRAHLAGAPGLWFSDVPDPYVSIIGLPSIRDLERVTQATVDPVRFRANFYLAGSAPWEELRWIGKEIAIGGVRFKVEERIGRCAATEVNPRTGERDLSVLAALRSGFAHTDMGVYARPVSDGTIAVGDAVVAQAG
ncbi:MAG: MOSC domain-containing protein [Reyranellaceae bacterium]